MAQRLVRKLDENTKIQIEPDAESLERINKVVATLPKNVVKPNMIGLKLYKPGSTESNPFGYSGQMAIREQFQMTGEILEYLKSNNATSIDGLEQAQSIVV